MVEFKRTLALEEGGDIYRDEQKKSEWYDGLRSAEQELKLTLATVQGEQPFAPDFGLDVFAATGTSPAVLKREIRKALQPDDRVKSVDEVIVEEGLDSADRHYTVTVNLTLVTGEDLQLSEVRI